MEKCSNEKISWVERLSYDAERIVNIEISNNKKTVELTEACDLYFSAKLTKKQFSELIDELTVLRDSMEDT